ncbi:MAG: hypothetical protein AB7N76_10315 [Planctomycetota bacterium]
MPPRAASSALLTLALCCAACRSEGGGLAGQGAAANGARDEDTPEARLARELLAVRPGQVLWFELREGSPPGPPLPAALFAVGAEESLCYETLGVGERRGSGLRFLTRRGGLWVVPLGLGAATGQHEVLAGQGGRSETVSTPAGSYSALRFEHTAGRARVSYWFVPGEGLVRMRVRLDGAPALELERAGAARWGEALDLGRFPAGTPQETWESLARARRELSVPALQALIGEELWRRLGPAEGAGLPGAPPPDPQARAAAVREVIPQLLRAPLTLAEPWAGDAARVTARATLRTRAGGQDLEGAALLAQERGADGRWRWSACDPP